jgi:phospho-N-acetylmuramoyl-pentapeptide-transferase
MLLWLIQHIALASPLAGLAKITARGSLAAMVGFVLAVMLGPKWIAWLALRFREPIKCDSPELCRLNQGKNATPTMGGLFILAGLAGSLLLAGDLTNRYLLLALAVTGGLTLLGAIDDLVKLRSEKNGISARSKLSGQIVIATAAAFYLYYDHASLPDGLTLPPPLNMAGFSLGILFVPLAIVVIVGASNSVNLTDGLDGLAGGCLLCAAAAMAVVVYAAGHAQWAAYLHVPHVSGCGELAVVAGGVIGAVVGFLWFNCHPAQVFMGNTGSLPLGGLLGLMAVVARQELLLILLGGVFVAEALSVILQVGWFKWRKRRIFRCAPVHHHFQFLGWPENKIVVRFWIAAALCALLATACLRINVVERPPGLTAEQLAGDERLVR